MKLTTIIFKYIGLILKCFFNYKVNAEFSETIKTKLILRIAHRKNAPFRILNNFNKKSILQNFEEIYEFFY